MSIFSTIKNKVATKLLGTLITDFGTLPLDEHGGEMSLSLRRYPGKPPHLQVKMVSGEALHFQIACTKAWADKLDHVSQEMRKHIHAQAG